MFFFSFYFIPSIPIPIHSPSSPFLALRLASREKGGSGRTGATPSFFSSLLFCFHSYFSPFIPSSVWGNGFLSLWSIFDYHFDILFSFHFFLKSLYMGVWWASKKKVDRMPVLSCPALSFLLSCFAPFSFPHPLQSALYVRTGKAAPEVL